MRKVENIKIIPERKEVTVTYFGNCPECGYSQESHFSSGVDKLCMKCILKKEQSDRQLFLDTYVGSKILVVAEREDDCEIIIKTKEGKVFSITIDVDYQEYEKTFKFKELNEGDACWFK